ncbi:MAG: hypothetical protein IT378_22545, partial [Sandaracinaceae bacterium]|nr:hypothetical protein [Sandaracinaceae bacterium]
MTIPEAVIREAWERGQRTWGVRVLLSPPAPHAKTSWEKDEPLAYI